MVPVIFIAAAAVEKPLQENLQCFIETTLLWAPRPSFPAADSLAESIPYAKAGMAHQQQRTACRAFSTHREHQRENAALPLMRAAM